MFSRSLYLNLRFFSSSKYFMYECFILIITTEISSPSPRREKPPATSSWRPLGIVSTRGVDSHLDCGNPVWRLHRFFSAVGRQSLPWWSLCFISTSVDYFVPNAQLISSLHLAFKDSVHSKDYSAWSFWFIGNSILFCDSVRCLYFHLKTGVLVVIQASLKGCGISGE